GEDAFYGRYRRLILKVKGYVILFKKLNSKGMPMNIYTENVRKLSNQEIQLSLFNESKYSESPILYFGYEKNKLGEYTQPRIVYIDENKIKFVIDAEQMGYTIDLFSEVETSPATVKVKPILKDKLKKQKAQ